MKEIVNRGNDKGLGDWLDNPVLTHTFLLVGRSALATLCLQRMSLSKALSSVSYSLPKP